MINYKWLVIIICCYCNNVSFCLWSEVLMISDKDRLFSRICSTILLINSLYKNLFKFCIDHVLSNRNDIVWIIHCTVTNNFPTDKCISFFYLIRCSCCLKCRITCIFFFIRICFLSCKCSVLFSCCIICSVKYYRNIAFKTPLSNECSIFLDRLIREWLAYCSILILIEPANKFPTIFINKTSRCKLILVYSLTWALAQYSISCLCIYFALYTRTKCSGIRVKS